jgi:hypothetical protein
VLGAASDPPKYSSDFASAGETFCSNGSRLMFWISGKCQSTSGPSQPAGPDRAWIYRRTGPEAFVRNQIATEQPAPAGGFIIKDLLGGAEIVTRGAQFLLSKEFRAQIQVGEDR